MPLFDFVCETKGCRNKESDVIIDPGKPIGHICDNCGQPMRRVFNAPAKFEIDFIPGYNRGADQYFDTKAQRESWMRENNKERIR